MPPPNLLVITTDQQSANALSAAGNPYLHTPAVDSLAAHGMRFEAAYAANPVCVPSRTSYHTGTPSHQNGITTNIHADTLPVHEPCLAARFRDHGYVTAHLGKWHVPRSIHDTAWSGFDHIDIVKDNGADDAIPDAALRFINTPRQKPFLLFAEFVNPHDICETARQLSGHQQKLPNGPIPPFPQPDLCPPLLPNHPICNDEPPEIRIHQNDPGTAAAYPVRDWPQNDPRWRQYRWAYHRLVEKVDANIGKLLDGLRRAGNDLVDNTVILFTSDHGDGQGAHRLNQKSHFYDEIARIPFIISWKGRTPPAVNTSHLVNMGLDLFPTLFDFAGIPIPENLLGQSAAQVAQGRPAPTHRPFIVIENNYHHGFGNPGEVHGRMVRSEHHKYVRYNRGRPCEQLFDLQTDPHELCNLAPNPAAAKILAAHRTMLNTYIHETADNFPPT